MTALLEVRGLTTEHAPTGATILEDVGFALGRREVLGIVGESGSGKSMLALSVMGLLPPAIRRRSGTVALDGEDLTALPPDGWRRRRGRELAMIFQEPMTALNPVMRVGAQVAEVLVRRRAFARAAARAEAQRLFEQVEIPSARQRLDAYPHELSGGLRQRVVIAVALAADPKVLVADEPTTALDVTIQAQILDLLRRLGAERDLALLFITHDLGVIAEIADRVLVLYAGRVAEEAPVRQLFDAPRHPYTQALLASIPHAAGPRGRLVDIPGAVPSVAAMPPGCRFAPRCPLVRPVCETAPPPAKPVAPAPAEPVAPEHRVACLAAFGYAPEAMVA